MFQLELAFDNKFYLGISEEAYRVLESDRSTFRQGEEPDRVATFLNQVFRNYREDARASIEQHLGAERRHFLGYLNRHGSGPRSAENELARQISENYLQRKRVREVEAVTEGFSLHGPHYSFRIDNENAAYLTGEAADCGLCAEPCDEEQAYRLWEKAKKSKTPELKAMGGYLRAVFEEYARLSYPERERIYYRQIIRDAESRSPKQGLRVVKRNGITLVMRPLGFRSDPATLYNYLVGYAISRNDARPATKPLTLRLSYIKAVTPCTLPHAALSAEERTALIQMMKERGVAYLVGACVDVEVLLTSKGMRLYRSIQWNRPNIRRIDCEKDGLTRCHFWCTEYQAILYFRQLGADAEVLGPPTLREKLKEFYQNGAARYGTP